MITKDSFQYWKVFSHKYEICLIACRSQDWYPEEFGVVFDNLHAIWQTWYTVKIGPLIKLTILVLILLGGPIFYGIPFLFVVYGIGPSNNSPKFNFCSVDVAFRFSGTNSVIVPSLTMVSQCSILVLSTAGDNNRGWFFLRRPLGHSVG